MSPYNCPPYSRSSLTAGGQPYPFVTFYVNDDDARLQGGFAASVRDGDEIIVVPAIAGG